MFLQLCCFQGEVIGNEGSEMIFFTGKTISETAKVLASKSAYKGFSMAVACSKNSLSSELLSYVWIKPFLERGASGLWFIYGAKWSTAKFNVRISWSGWYATKSQRNCFKFWSGASF